MSDAFNERLNEALGITPQYHDSAIVGRPQVTRQQVESYWNKLKQHSEEQVRNAAWTLAGRLKREGRLPDAPITVGYHSGSYPYPLSENMWLVDIWRTEFKRPSTGTYGPGFHDSDPSEMGPKFNPGRYTYYPGGTYTVPGVLGLGGIALNKDGDLIRLRAPSNLYDLPYLHGESWSRDLMARGNAEKIGRLGLHAAGVETDLLDSGWSSRCDFTAIPNEEPLINKAMMQALLDTGKRHLGHG